MVIKQLASVLSHCYGPSPVAAISPLDVSLSTQLGNTPGSVVHGFA